MTIFTVNKTMNKTIYQAFGLHFDSEILLPELLQRQDTQEADVKIEIQDLSEWRSVVNTRENNFTMQSIGFMFEIPNTALFCIQDGKRIGIHPFPDADMDKIRLYVLGTCMGVLLLQRGILPLHGSAVVINNKAYAFVGESGAGKSTLASTFVQSGFQLLSDDVIAVSYQNGEPVVHPAYPQQKLWKESLDLFGMSEEQFKPLHDEVSKFAIPVTKHFHNKTVPLAGVFELVKMDSEYVAMREMNRLERLHAMMLHTYRGALIPRLGLKQWHFSGAAALAGELFALQILRPTSGFTAPELMNQIMRKIYQEEMQGDTIYSTEHFK